MRTLLGLVAVVVVAVLAAEATMQPTQRDRVVLVGLFLGAGLVAAALAWLLPRLTSRLSSLRQAILLVSSTALAVAALTVVAASGSMFISSHDLRLVLVALALGVGLGTVLAAGVASPLEADLERMRTTANRVAEGDLEVRTGIERADEVGAVAATFDQMIVRLAAAETERTQVETARQHFLAAVSHDLRTPLTALIGAIESMQDGVAEDPARTLRSMKRDTDLLAIMIEDLFMLARIESGGLSLRPEPVDLAELADDAVESMRPTAARSGIGLRVESAGAARIVASPIEIGRVLRNLLDNAIRHAPDGSQVELRIDLDGPVVRVTVADQGPGFPAHFLATAFEEFTRVDTARSRRAGGAGLGLAIARGLVEAHGGAIEAAPGPGGRVTFELPVPAV